MEMTGLDPERERIIEIACILTDRQLEIVAEGPDLVVHQKDELLEAMDDWNREHHGASGLTDRVRASKVSEAEAEEQVLKFLEENCEKRTAPLAGNSVHQDRRFLRRFMPKVDDHMHYRIVDVSSVKELVRHWYPDLIGKAPPKREAHRASDDILESIEELRFYRANAFR